MKATHWDLMRLAEIFDGEFCLTDFTEDEIDEMLGLFEDDASPDEIRRRYFEFHDDVKDRTLDKHKWSD